MRRGHRLESHGRMRLVKIQVGLPRLARRGHGSDPGGPLRRFVESVHAIDKIIARLAKARDHERHRIARQYGCGISDHRVRAAHYGSERRVPSRFQRRDEGATDQLAYWPNGLPTRYFFVGERLDTKGETFERRRCIECSRSQGLGIFGIGESPESGGVLLELLSQLGGCRQDAGGKQLVGVDFVTVDAAQTT